MTRIFLLLVFLSLSNTFFAQVQAPDYKDQSKWKYEECEDPGIFSFKDENMLVMHDDYGPISSPGSHDDQILVIYKPVTREILDKEGEEKFREVARTQPWLMLSILVLDNLTRDETFHIFEYDGNSWNFVASPSSQQEADDILNKYGLK